MIVYRVCKKMELENIFEVSNFKYVGSNYEGTIVNTHKYDKDSKFLHFFPNKDSILFLKTLKDRYFCVYDIPDEILNKNMGTGYYLDFINYRDMKEVVEYAINTDVMTMEYLKQVYYIKEELEYEDLLDNDILGFSDIVYNKNEEKVLLKIKK